MDTDSGAVAADEHINDADQPNAELETSAEPVKELQMTTVEAQEHISCVRRDKGLDSGLTDLGANVSDLTAALAV